MTMYNEQSESSRNTMDENISLKNRIELLMKMHDKKSNNFNKYKYHILVFIITISGIYLSLKNLDTQNKLTYRISELERKIETLENRLTDRILELEKKTETVKDDFNYYSDESIVKFNQLEKQSETVEEKIYESNVKIFELKTKTEIYGYIISIIAAIIIYSFSTIVFYFVSISMRSIVSGFALIKN